MPYIKQSRREEILIKKPRPTGWQKLIALDEIMTPGELNYAITETILHFFKESQRSYQDINDVLGALEGAKNEFYRRKAVPFEEIKIKENGDVYEA